jgi:hypothetical protein
MGFFASTAVGGALGISAVQVEGNIARDGYTLVPPTG